MKNDVSELLKTPVTVLKSKGNGIKHKNFESALWRNGNSSLYGRYTMPRPESSYKSATETFEPVLYTYTIHVVHM